MNRYENNQINAAIKSVAISTMTAVVDTVLGKKLFDNISKTKNCVETVEKLGPGFETETAMTKIWATPAKVLGSKLDILGIAVTAYSLYSDYNNNHGWNIGKSMSVDAVAFILGFAAGAFITGLGLTFAPAVIAMGLVGLGVGTLDYLAKKQLGVN